MKFNKNLLIASLFLALGVSSFGQNNVGTLVTDPVRPFSISSTHPSAIANEIKGGPFSSSNLAGLSNIPAPRLEIGSIGYATNTGLYYRLTATNPATWSSIDGINITNLNASNITGSIPFLNISNALTNANVAFGTATFNNAIQGPNGTAANPAFKFGTNQSGLYYGSQLGFGTFVGVSIFGSNVARFQSNRVVFDQPIDFLSSTNLAALTTRTNLGIQDFVTNPVVQVVSGGTGATNAGGARTNLGLGATNDVQFNTVNARGIFDGTNEIIDIENNWLSYAGFGVTFEWADTENTTYVPFAFGGTNASVNAATTRTNLGLGATWLTNTAASNFRTAIGLGASQSVAFAEVVASTSLEAGSSSNTVIIDGDGINFGHSGIASTTRTNLGLGWSALTNSNAGTSLVSVNTNGAVVSPTNFWQVAPIQTLVQDLTVVVTSQTNNATNARNLYVYSLATNVSGISNTILLPTNTATFAGDEVTVIHRGNTNTTTVIRQAGSTNNLITLSRFDEAVKFIKDGEWEFYHNISYVEPIQFSGTNASDNIAASRTNLGLPLTALTNSNTANFQAAVFQTNTTPIGSAFNTIVAWMEVNVFTNGSNTSFRVPLFK